MYYFIQELAVLPAQPGIHPRPLHSSAQDPSFRTSVPVCMYAFRPVSTNASNACLCCVCALSSWAYVCAYSPSSSQYPICLQWRMAGRFRGNEKCQFSNPYSHFFAPNTIPGAPWFYAEILKTIAPPFFPAFRPPKAHASNTRVYTCQCLICLQWRMVVPCA